MSLVTLSGCTLLEATGEAVGVVGKAAWEGTKAVGSVAYTGTQMAGQTANQTNKTFSRSSPTRRQKPVEVTGARAVIPLEQEGAAYFVRLKINDRVEGRFLLDTGASAMQISRRLARRLHLEKAQSRAIPVTLAGGHTVAGRLVMLEEVAIGTISARKVAAIVLDHEKGQKSDGLLGMSFLENFRFSIDTKRNELVLERK
ncbi:MAG: clan AA aspartic protease [Elusimicrobia bacterium]|nr:clan AA aspartic protease [Elusimicrobiota bacterium]